jgi:fumarate hydratase class II
MGSTSNRAAGEPDRDLRCLDLRIAGRVHQRGELALLMFERDHRQQRPETPACEGEAMTGFRVEIDARGEVSIPADAHYGAETQRAVENFPISGMRFSDQFIRALALVKAAAAEVNQKLGLLKAEFGDAIITAANEVAVGQWNSEFVVDIFQTGSGTSTNMNANEVIASRANELLGGRKGDHDPIRPNDEVNKCQSSNDVIPTAIHLAALDGIDHDLLPSLEALAFGLETKGEEFKDVLKTGRTHLQDAVPIMLGQEFGGWASQVRHSVVRIQVARAHLLELPIGGTALGTGLNAHPEFAGRMCAALAKTTTPGVRMADNLFEAIGSRDALVESSGTLKTVAVSLLKIASDIRLLSCGPHTGIAEITIPELQSGSSIMPGKVNPVMPEMMIQVCAQVIGNDTAVTLGGVLGQLDLNAMMPLMAHNLLQSIALLAAACRSFDERCVSRGPAIPANPENVRGIVANRDRCRALVESSLMPLTALVPKLGYHEASTIAEESLRTGRTVREIVLERKLFSATELEWLLDLTRMTRPFVREEAGDATRSAGSAQSKYEMAQSEDRWRDDGGEG